MQRQQPGGGPSERLRPCLRLRGWQRLRLRRLKVPMLVWALGFSLIVTGLALPWIFKR
jgi:hypothetical protein